MEFVDWLTRADDLDNFTCIVFVEDDGKIKLKEPVWFAGINPDGGHITNTSDDGDRERLIEIIKEVDKE